MAAPTVGGAAATAGRAALSAGKNWATDKLSNPNTYKMPGSGSGIVSSLTGRSRLTYLDKVKRAGGIAQQMPPNVQAKVFTSLMRGRKHGISSRDIQSFNRVFSLVNRVNRHISKHARKSGRR